MMAHTRPCAGGSSTQKPTTGDEFLPPSLWSSIPTELLERILAFLPFPYLFRLRTVCRRWNALPRCAYFRQVARPWGACLPVLFCKDASEEDEGWNSNSWSAFNTTSQQWLRLPPLTCLDARHPKYLVVGSGGLLCIGDFDSTENLVVCNPVTRCFRELPQTFSDWTEPDLTAMAIIGGGGYKLILAGNRVFSPDDLSYRRTEVYDSESLAWSVAGDIPQNLELHSQEGAFCKNVLYCLARNPKQGVWNTLAAFDVAKRNWTIVSHNLPHGSRTPHVIASRGRILSIAEHEDAQQENADCAILFELNLVTKKWRELSRLPSEMYVGIGKRVVACTVDGDYICVTGCSANRWFTVMYLSSEGTWQQVPAFPVEDSKGSELLLSSSPFRPSLEPV